MRMLLPYHLTYTNMSPCFLALTLLSFCVHAMLLSTVRLLCLTETGGVCAGGAEGVCSSEVGVPCDHERRQHASCSSRAQPCPNGN